MPIVGSLFGLLIAGAYASAYGLLVVYLSFLYAAAFRTVVSCVHYSIAKCFSVFLASLFKCLPYILIPLLSSFCCFLHCMYTFSSLKLSWIPLLVHSSPFFITTCSSPGGSLSAATGVRVCLFGFYLHYRWSSILRSGACFTTLGKFSRCLLIQKLECAP